MTVLIALLSSLLTFPVQYALFMLHASLRTELICNSRPDYIDKTLTIVPIFNSACITLCVFHIIDYVKMSTICNKMADVSG